VTAFPGVQKLYFFKKKKGGGNKTKAETGGERKGRLTLGGRTASAGDHGGIGKKVLSKKKGGAQAGRKNHLGALIVKREGRLSVIRRWEEIEKSKKSDCADQ